MVLERFVSGMVAEVYPYFLDVSRISAEGPDSP
jgi:hypothetical protein